MKIAIIEGDSSNRKEIKKVIAKCNFGEVEICEATSADEALALLQEKDFDIIILEGRLKTGHGRDVIKALKPDLWKKIIVYSFDTFFAAEAARKGIQFVEKDSTFVNLEVVLHHIASK